MFISSCATIYFFVKNFFFECLYFSEYDTRMFLYAFWLRNRPSINYVRYWGNGGGVMQNVHRCVQGEGVERSIIRHVRTKWMDPNKYCGIFFVHWFDQLHYSITAIIRIIHISIKKQAFHFLKRNSYTNAYLKFLCDPKLITPILSL